MSGPLSLVLFRDDLRLADNPALSAAVRRGAPVVCVYVRDEQSPGIRPAGAASRWWLHGSLAALDATLREAGNALVRRRGQALPAVMRLAAETGADAVFWNRRYGAPERAADARLKADLRAAGATAESFPAALLFEPWTVHTGGGGPFRVFTPFWRSCRAMPAPRAPLPAPARILAPRRPPASEDLASWGLRPTRPDWAAGLRAAWTPGEKAARRRLSEFAGTGLAGYDTARDEPAANATSRLSPHLRFGEVSPFTVWHEVVAAGGPGASTRRFLTELGWREFAWHTLFHFPDLAARNWRAAFDRFPWPPVNPQHLHAWQTGATGVPLVDAGMRELWHTGSMHNRVRMVAASFLVKNLLIPWQEGERWFWDTLVDADPASNPFNWQWVAGSGADGAPYFRIFNPERQRARFDPHDVYTRRWTQAGGDDTPDPIVDLPATRRRALNAYDAMRRAGQPAAD